MTRLLLALCAAASLHCATTSAASAPTPAASAAFAPTPYTAEQIRDATREGRSYEWRVEIPGKPPVLRTTTFTRVTPELAEMTSRMRDEQGTPRGEPRTMRSTWDDLRRHAEFPQDAVRISEETVTVPAGTFDCQRYQVTEGDEVTSFFFAKSLPGAPVLSFTDKAGTRVMTTTLVRYEAGK